MNQEEANLKIHQLGVLILLELPEKIQFGIDNSQWTIGKRFQGVKLIPLGTHYVHYSLASENHQYKLGFFCTFTTENRIIVKRWNQEYDDLIDLDNEEAESYRHSFRIFDLDCYLGVYPSNTYQTWAKVSNYISKKVLDKLDPIQRKLYALEKEYNGEIQQESDDDQSENSEQVRREQAKAQQNVGQKEDFNIMAGTIYYSDVATKCYKHKVSGQQLTQINFDKSEIFLQMLKKEYFDDYNIFIGEIQYSFVKFLLGEHYDSFEQWKKLIILITSCDQLVKSNPEIFIDFIPVFYEQLAQIPQDFFIDPLSRNNFVKSCIKNLIEICCDNEIGQQRKLTNRCMKLQELLNKHFIQEVDDDDQDNPVVVDDFNFIQI
ncbi:hypothetical protein pb186bvf_020780 [Paramecium bursaria]